MMTKVVKNFKEGDQQESRELPEIEDQLTIDHV